MAMADDEKTSALELAQVLSADQALTAKLIKISNSSFYGFSRGVSTVKEAVILLGFREVKRLAISASMIAHLRAVKSCDERFCTVIV